jgi:hypothetical protein
MLFLSESLTLALTASGHHDCRLPLDDKYRTYGDILSEKFEHIH